MKYKGLMVLAVLSVVIAFSLRGWVALRSTAPLNVDEQYYLSMAANSAHGHGLYPTTLGLTDVNLYPGNGYGVLLYTAAYSTLGESVLSLRVMSLAFGLLILPAVWLGLRALYDQRVAWTGVILFPWLSFFWMANSVRFDTVTIAFVAWMLYGMIYAFQHQRGLRFHLVYGLLLGLGLQVHLNTTIAAFAFGLYYLAHYVREYGWRVKLVSPPVMLAGGYLMGAAVFVAFNFLPDQDQFFSVLADLREWEAAVYAPGSYDPDQSLLGSMLDLAALTERETGRYADMIRLSPAFEIVLVAAGLLGLVVRRTQADRDVLLMIGGVVIAAGVITINGSFFYLMHPMPILFIPVPALLVRGLRREAAPPTGGRLHPLIVTAVAVGLALPQAELAGMATGWRELPPEPPPPRYLEPLRQLADDTDLIAGPAADFVAHLPDYPRYLSHGATQEQLGMLLTDTETPMAYWQNKAPDFVFGFNDFDAISGYVYGADYVNVAFDVWAAPDHWSDPPDFETPLADFDERLRLLSISTSAESLSACESWQVLAHWQTLQADIPGVYSVGLHLTTADGTLITQNDAPPAGLSLDQWPVFQFLPDLRQLTIPCETPPGTYTLNILVYDYRDGTRLPVDGGATVYPALTINVEEP